MTKKDCAIGIDLGGTNLKAGVVDGSLKVIQRISLPIGRAMSAVAAVDLIAETVEKLVKTAPGPVTAIGCGVPGIVDFETGVVYKSPNIPEWEDEPIRDLVAKRLRLPLAFDNDANMHALGEASEGAGRGVQNMVLLTLGSGIGGGIILDGGIFRGDSGFAGEVGHIVIDPEGPVCGCGGRGCWERYAASRAFSLFASLLSKAERGAFEKAAGCDAAGLTPEIVANLADRGNETAIEMWRRYGGYLGIGIATILNVLGVETFVIGGGIARSWDRFIDEARKSAFAHTYREHEKKLVLKKAMLGDDAGIVGAAIAAFKIV